MNLIILMNGKLGIMVIYMHIGHGKEISIIIKKSFIFLILEK